MSSALSQIYLRKYVKEKNKMTEEKICSCNPSQSEIKADEAIDFIRNNNQIYARYHKDCAVHGFKRLTESGEKSDHI
jgi:predicted glycosyl hydrolase (DUF1957 family)